MGNDIKPVGGGGIWGWFKGGIFAVAKSAAASETWKLIAPLVLAMIGASATTLVGMAQQAPGLAIAVCAAIVFALVAFGATKLQALLASRSQAAPPPESEEDRIYRIKRAEADAEDRLRRERAMRLIAGGIGDHFAQALEEQEADRKAEAEARRRRMIRDASLPPPPPPPIEPAPPRQSATDLSHIGKAILDRYDGEAEVFPYRKAVLQLSEVKATAMRQAGAKHLSKIQCHMDIENHTKQQFRKCRVRLAAINGARLYDDTFLRIGRLKGEDTETEFAVRPGHSKSRINFMKRDLDDVVSNPPFLLCLNDRDFPLSDGKEYKFVFALECEYEHPTYATVRFFVPEREKVEIELLTQTLDMPDD